MKQHLAFFIATAAITFAAAGIGTHTTVAAATPAAGAAAVTKVALGQGTSALVPDRVLLLQRRTFAPGSDSGAHPAPGPTVLYVDSGVVEFAVDKGAALLTRSGMTQQEPVAAGTQVELGQGDAVFYDAGVVHDVANPGADPAVTLEARLNPREETPATPKP
jgi:quercetin dioxygenase-like cupin family protein